MASTRLYIAEMRQRLGLEPDDESRDDEIENMSPKSRLRLLCGWHLGYPTWADRFMSWAADAGLTISEK